jgi:hypothetical protein
MMMEQINISMLLNVISFVLAAGGFFLALVAIAIALWQVRDARRTCKLEGEIIALEAFLTAELAGERRDKKIIQTLLESIFDRVEKLGAKDIFKVYYQKMLKT